MSSYDGEKTAKTQEMHRHAARDRKAVGRGARHQNIAVQIDPKEAREFVPRNLYGKIDPALVQEIETTMMNDRLDNRMLTSNSLARFVQFGVPSTLILPDRDGKVYQKIPGSYDRGPEIPVTFKPLVIEIDQNPEMAHFAGKKIIVRTSGFKMLEDGKEVDPNTAIWSVNLRMQGPFGFTFYYDKFTQKVLAS